MPDEKPPCHLPNAKFPTGQLCITPNALRQIGLEDFTEALRRHVTGDWGEVDAHDRKANDDALREGSRIFSVYRSESGIKLWVITEADRTVTTILLPEGY